MDLRLENLGFKKLLKNEFIKFKKPMHSFKKGLINPFKEHQMKKSALMLPAYSLWFDI